MGFGNLVKRAMKRATRARRKAAELHSGRRPNLLIARWAG